MITTSAKIGLLLAAWLAAAPVVAHDRERQSLTFAIVPQQAATPLAEAWTLLLDWLAEQTGVRLEFRTARDIPTFEQRLATGDYDLAYMNPYHYAEFERRVGYRAFARENRQLVGLLVVRADSPIRSPAGLAGTQVAFPTPTAFAATVLPRAHLDALGIAITPRYVASHESVYHAVASGLYPAGGGIERTFASLAPALRGRLRVLWRTPPSPPHAFAAHPRVPRDVVHRIQDAMTVMHTDPRGRAALDKLAIERLAAASGRDWQALRHSGLKLPALVAPREAP